MFSCIGYESKSFSLSSLQPSTKIALLPHSQQLAEVKVATKKRKYKLKRLGISKKPKTKFFDYNVTAQNGTIRAIYIPNVHSTTGILKAANVFITDNGFPDAHFRLHIYSVSPLEIKPDKELTSTNIIASGLNGNEWVQIDLKDQRILVPENGCFVGIEWFDHPKSTYFLDTIKNDGMAMVNGKFKDTTFIHLRSGNGMVLGSRSEAYKFAKNKLWYKTHFSKDWVNWCSSTTNENNFNIPDTLPSGVIFQHNENNTFYKVPCINIQVSFPKEKIKLEFDDPKKRKLNRVERVKEDNYNYPQASVLELFNSLIC
jgi:hypothetical protein